MKTGSSAPATTCPGRMTTRSVSFEMEDRAFGDAPMNYKARLRMKGVPDPAGVAVELRPVSETGIEPGAPRRHAPISHGALPQVVAGEFSCDGGILMTKYYCRTRVRGWA